MSSKLPKPTGKGHTVVSTNAPDEAVTEDEAQQIDRFLARRKAKPTGRVKLGAGNHLTFDHANQAVGQVQLMEALGITDYDFLDIILQQLGNVSANRGKVDERDLNFMLSVIKDIEPRDQVETLLGAQMAATHMAAMTFARRLNHVDTIPQQDSAEKALNKLLRTFSGQMEALRKYRTGGEQRVIVQHVHVNEGGQAVVGNVTHGGDAKGA